MSRLSKALLLVHLQFLLVIPNCLSERVERGANKSPDQYWAETGLNSQELETLLGPETCHQEEQSFLSCVNALSQMAERYQLVLQSDGQFRKITTEDIEDKISEKRDLSKWSELFRQKGPSFSFLKAWRDLDSLYVSPKERASTIAAGINGFLSIYKDPHTYIMPLAMYEEVVANSENKNTNAGFIARKIGTELMIRKVLEGSPAANVGLKKGDRILAINGTPVKELLPSKISDLIRMRDLERMGLKVQRGSEVLYLEILRSESVFPSVVSRFLSESRGIGILTVHKFARGSCQLSRDALIQLKEQNLRGLLLDLRDNPGGQVEEAACIANLFVDQGVFLFETRYLDTSKPSDRYTATKDPIYRGPLAILINSGSASASEIVAGALRDQNRARLVGERSYGKGTFQDGSVWLPNSKIAFFQTEGLYYFPSGWTPQLIGLQPDLVVNFNSGEYLREEELYWNPLVPVDSWTGPQALSWLTEKDCDLDRSEETFLAEDPQLSKAQALLSCGANHERHGSL